MGFFKRVLQKKDPPKLDFLKVFCYTLSQNRDGKKPMKKVILIICIILIFSQLSFARKNKKIGIVTVVRGKVFAKRTSGDFYPLKVKASIYNNMIIKTDKKSKVLIFYLNKTYHLIKENQKLYVYYPSSYNNFEIKKIMEKMHSLSTKADNNNYGREGLVYDYEEKISKIIKLYKKNKFYEVLQEIGNDKILLKNEKILYIAAFSSLAVKDIQKSIELFEALHVKTVRKYKTASIVGLVISFYLKKNLKKARKLYDALPEGSFKELGKILEY